MLRWVTTQFARSCTRKETGNTLNTENLITEILHINSIYSMDYPPPLTARPRFKSISIRNQKTQNWPQTRPKQLSSANYESNWQNWEGVLFYRVTNQHPPSVNTVLFLQRTSSDPPCHHRKNAVLPQNVNFSWTNINVKKRTNWRFYTWSGAERLLLTAASVPLHQ